VDLYKAGLVVVVALVDHFLVVQQLEDLGQSGKAMLVAETQVMLHPLIHLALAVVQVP